MTNKDEEIDKLRKLFKYCDKEYILQCMFNYFSTDKLKKFRKFVKGEVNG